MDVGIKLGEEVVEEEEEEEVVDILIIHVIRTEVVEEGETRIEEVAATVITTIAEEEGVTLIIVPKTGDKLPRSRLYLPTRRQLSMDRPGWPNGAPNNRNSMLPKKPKPRLGAKRLLKKPNDVALPNYRLSNKP